MKTTFNRLAAASLFLAVCFSGCGDGVSNTKARSKAPDFTLPLASSDSLIRLSEINSQKPVLLVFWASWCPSCVEEIPELKKLEAESSESGIEIVSVNVQESREDVDKFLKKKRITYRVALDEEGDVASRFGLVGLPAAVLLAKGGEILYYGFTLPENLEQYFEPRSA